ncbi:MAG: hypothetical protein GY940_22920 [bacterium]|nr:hypothetical protein [bacterium]
MKEKEKPDQTFEHVFENKTEALPEDKYFKKIWDSIETKAPVGEKYYLRSVFSVLLFLLFFVVFFLFYTDFLASVLTLKEIRRENINEMSSAPVGREGDFKNSEPAKGIRINSTQKSLIRLKREERSRVELDFFKGHAVIEMRTAARTLIIHLPDVKLVMEEGKCNIFCYDGIVRVIPLSHSVTVETNGKKQTVESGETFYLLDKNVVKY